MKAQQMNKEGMTLYEWICAAGVAINRRAFYIESTHLVWDGRYMSLRGEPTSFKRTRWSQTRYGGPDEQGLRRGDVAKKHLAAWDAGEDPTEWRASP